VCKKKWGRGYPNIGEKKGTEGNQSDPQGRKGEKGGGNKPRQENWRKGKRRGKGGQKVSKDPKASNYWPGMVGGGEGTLRKGAKRKIVGKLLWRKPRKGRN